MLRIDDNFNELYNPNSVVTPKTTTKRKRSSHRRTGFRNQGSWDIRRNGAKAIRTKNMDVFTITQKKGPFTVDALVGCLGEDLMVILHGGKGHIGAIGMAQPRQSLQDPKKTSSTSSVFTYPGHKEDMLVKEMSEELSRKLNKKVVVVAGVHWDGLKKREIENILQLCRKLTTVIIREVLKK
jgi:gallate decarboxylase subunit D